MSDILKELNPQQKEAVTTTTGPLLIIAGAGSGKTTVIARRVAYIIEKKLAKPREILALTFTDKAAQEMEERVDVLVPYGFIDTWISTFHSFGDRILRDNAFDVGLSPDFKVLSKPQQVLFFGQNLFRFDLKYFRPLSNPNKFIGAMISFFSRLKDENISPQEFQKALSTLKSDDEIELQKYQELATAYTQYEKLKDDAGVLDYGDLITKTIDLFQKRPAILKNYQEQFKYILVDEYQDTNYAQNELVKLLGTSHKNVCVVGDDDQSIYKFRGAAVSNILDFVKSFKSAKQIVLTQNYRSTQQILDSAYRLIRNNDPDRLEVKNDIDKRLKSSILKAGVPPQELFAQTLSEEADQAAEEIDKLMKSKGYAYRDFAILVRANSQADHFLRALNFKGIPHKFVGTSGLYNQPEVNVLISFLTAITNFEDSLNIFNLLTSDIYKMPPEDAIKLASYAKRKTRSLFYILKNLDKVSTPRHSERSEESQNFDSTQLDIPEKSRVIIEKALQNLQESIESSTKLSVGKVLYNFLNKTSYLKKLDRIGGVENQIKIQNIAKFFEKIREFEQIAKVDNVAKYIDYLEAVRSAGDDPSTIEFDPDTDAVNVMTIHGAKGLEFPVVFMVNLVSDRFPSRWRQESIEIPEKLIKESLPQGDWHIQEERRLFYVGVTRAKELLYFSWSKDAGGRRIKKISPFILESLDKTASDKANLRLSALEKIEQFAPQKSTHIQTMLFDVDVLKLTQGSLDDYLTCAFKYRYIHVLRLPISKHHAIVYGAALHSAVAAFNRSKKIGRIITLPSLLEVFENSWDSEGFLTIEHEEKRKVQGKIALSEFYKRESKSKDIPSLIEAGFKFAIGGVTIVGRFDRVDVEQGSNVTIIDYKSSENIDQERANSQAKESLQLAIYALYYYKKHNIIPHKVTLYFLETGITGSYTPTRKDLLKTEELISQTALSIKSDLKNNSFKANPKYFGREPACNYCAYNSICPFSLAKV